MSLTTVLHLTRSTPDLAPGWDIKRWEKELEAYWSDVIRLTSIGFTAEQVHKSAKRLSRNRDYQYWITQFEHGHISFRQFYANAPQHVVERADREGYWE